MLSSSLSLNDLSEADRGVLVKADSGCGLSLRGVRGWLMLVDELADGRRNREGLKGDSAAAGAGEFPEDAWLVGLSEEIIR